jgi:hypothetical protein
MLSFCQTTVKQLSDDCVTIDRYTLSDSDEQKYSIGYQTPNDLYALLERERLAALEAGEKVTDDLNSSLSIYVLGWATLHL